MDWTQETCLQVINEYRKREVLWNPGDPLYYDKLKKKAAWRELSERFGKSSDALKKKMDSLRGSYRREKTRAERSRGTGKGRNKIYQSEWFAYKSLQFLDKDPPCKTPRNVQNTCDETPREHLDSKTLDDSSDQGNQLEKDQIVEDAEHSQASDVKKASTDTERTESKFPRKRLLKRKKVDVDPRIEEAFDYLRRAIADSKQPKDDCSLFGDYIAGKLRKFNNEFRAIAQHRISNSLFKLEMDVNQRTLMSTSVLPAYSKNHFVISSNFPQLTTEALQRHSRKTHRTMTPQNNINTSSSCSVRFPESIPTDTSSCPSSIHTTT